MNKKPSFKADQQIETAIKIALIGIMAVITFRIIQPFMVTIAWGVIIAVAVNPLIDIIAKRLGNRRKLAATLFALFVIAALIIPTILLVSASVDTVQEISTHLENNTLEVPPPPAKVAEWPIIGEPLYKTWELASSNLAAALQKFGPQLKDFALLILGKAGGGLRDVVMFIISIAISAALLATTEKYSAVTTKVVNRFAGPLGPDLKKLGTATVRGVMLGVVGVAVIQSVLAAIGMLLAGVPAAGLWAALVLILAVIQLPPIIILAPIAAWVFSFASTGTAVLFLIWALVVSGCDGFLKPVLMGRGVDAPMLVILIGALGGMILSGIIGLFVGAIVVATSYTLFMKWVDNQPSGETTEQME